MFVLNILSLICLCDIGLFVVANPDKGLERRYYDVTKAKLFFEEFQKTFQKKYLDKKEYNYRFQVFRQSLEEINKRNQDSVGEVYGITEFSDMKLDEFVQEHTGLKGGIVPNDTEEIEYRQYVEFVNLPENWDWRSKGVVTPVRHQGQCLSCWSFSAVGCVESQYAKKHGLLLSLSDQQLVDCYAKTCRSGNWPHLALQAAAKLGGFMLDQDYPYTSTYAVSGRCKFNKYRVYVRVNHGHQYPFKDEEILKKFLYSYGPVAIGISTTQGFLYYRGGIASAKYLGCRLHDPINHAVLLIGYGMENGVPYWIIKNSFGDQWGEQGFLRIRRGQNTCNILSYVAAADVA